MSVRFTAVRWPATAWSDFEPCTCTPRTRRRRPGGVELDLLLFLHGAGNQRSGDDGAEAFDGERAVDGQAEVARARPSRARWRRRARASGADRRGRRRWWN